MKTYEVDRTRSEIGFSVRHMMVTRVRGRFARWNATLAYDPDEPASSSVRADVETGSVDTHERLRDAYLGSPEFFDAERYPKMTFESTRVKVTGKGRYELFGVLTIRGTAHEVVLEVEEADRDKGSPGEDHLAFVARGSISRARWNLEWSQALEAGGVLVSDKVDVEVKVRFVAKDSRSS